MVLVFCASASPAFPSDVLNKVLISVVGQDLVFYKFLGRGHLHSAFDFILPLPIICSASVLMFWSLAS